MYEVVEDKLRVAEQLESETAHVIDTYACEWQSALHDSKICKRFSPFINTPETDSAVKFETVYDQPQPL